MLVIVIVVSVYTAGAASGLAAQMGSTWAAGTAAMGGASIGAAAFGGAMGSLVGQAAGMMMGVQDKFSFKDVVVNAGMAAAGAGLGAAMGVGANEATALTKMVKGTAQLNAAGAALYGGAMAVTHAGLNKAVGNPSGFRWRNVAAAMGTAALTNAMGLSDQENATSRFKGETFMNRVAGGFLSKGINYGIRKGLGDDKASWNMRDVAVDVFGNAVGNWIVGEMVHRGQQKQQLNQLADRVGIDPKVMTDEQQQVLLRALDARNNPNASIEERKDASLGLIKLSGASDEQAAEVMGLYEKNIFSTERNRTKVYATEGDQVITSSTSEAYLGSAHVDKWNGSPRS